VGRFVLMEPAAEKSSSEMESEGAINLWLNDISHGLSALVGIYREQSLASSRLSHQAMTTISRGLACIQHSDILFSVPSRPCGTRPTEVFIRLAIFNVLLRMLQRHDHSLGSAQFSVASGLSASRSLWRDSDCPRLVA